MKLTHSKDWYKQRIALEGDSEVGAGAMPASRKKATPKPSITPIDTRIAFGTLVGLWRRSRGWDVEKLAHAAGINPKEILEIEHSPQSAPASSVVNKLAEVFNLPAKPMLELAGLIEPRTPRLRKAAVRFAARSESVAALTEHERKTLEAFVATITEKAKK
jgi:HTH-type transcriptional regulator, competence development regulator